MRDNRVRHRIDCGGVFRLRIRGYRSTEHRAHAGNFLQAAGSECASTGRTLLDPIDRRESRRSLAMHDR
jgi:hypothetical protein